MREAVRGMQSGTMEMRERMAIEAECGRLVAGYAYLVDRRKYDDLVDLFTENCLFQRPDARVEGAAALRRLMDARPGHIATRHLCGMPFFETVEVDEATAVTYTVMFVEEGIDEGPNEVAGAAGLAEFHDRFRRTADGWRIAERTAKPAMIVKK